MNEDTRIDRNPCRFKYSFKKTSEFFGITVKQLEVLFEEKKTHGNKVIIGSRSLSKGAYYRMKDQAITNITKAIMTISLLVSCDVISHDDVMNIIMTTSNLLDEDVPVDEIFIRLKNFLKKTLR